MPTQGQGRASDETRRQRNAIVAETTIRRMHLRALEPYPGAHEPWQLQCKRCDATFSRAWKVLSRGSGCSACAAKKRIAADKAARTKAALADMKAAGFKPLDPYPGADFAWRSKCLSCGAIVSPKLNAVRHGTGCLQCATKRRGLKRRLPETEARRILANAMLQPIDGIPYPGATKQWPCTCMLCGLIVKPRVTNVRKQHGGCKRCAMLEGGVGFDVWSPAVIYLIAHDELGALKVGITSTNATAPRITIHRANGWRVIRVWETGTGQQAVYVESAILRWWRDELRLRPYCREGDMPQGGFTETVDATKVRASDVSRHITKALAQAVDLPPLPDRDETKAFRRKRCPVVYASGSQCRRKAAIGPYCENHATRIQLYGDPLKGPNSRGSHCLVLVDGEPCGKPVRSRDMCSVHYERWYTHGDPDKMLRPTPGTRSATCLVEVDGAACGRKIIAFEMCTKHYAHWKRHGDPLGGYFENPGQPCSVIEDGTPCPRLATSRGMCHKHYNRTMKYGDPLTTKRLPPDKRPKECQQTVDGRPCGRKVVSYGLCDMHRKRARKTSP